MTSFLLSCSDWGSHHYLDNTPDETTPVIWGLGTERHRHVHRVRLDTTRHAPRQNRKRHSALPLLAFCHPNNLRPSVLCSLLEHCSSQLSVRSSPVSTLSTGHRITAFQRDVRDHQFRIPRLSFVFPCTQRLRVSILGDPRGVYLCIRCSQPPDRDRPPCVSLRLLWLRLVDSQFISVHLACSRHTLHPPKSRRLALPPFNHPSRVLVLLGHSFRAPSALCASSR